MSAVNVMVTVLLFLEDYESVRATVEFQWKLGVYEVLATLSTMKVLIYLLNNLIDGKTHHKYCLVVDYKKMIPVSAKKALVALLSPLSGKIN
jgi:hypothetical protein